jgi:hypothetical protein
MSDTFLDNLMKDEKSRYEETKRLLSRVGVEGLDKIYSSANAYCAECTSQLSACLSDCRLWPVKNQILRMKKTVDKVEQKRNEIMGQSKKELENIPEGQARSTYGNQHIPGYNAPIDNFELTRQLTDGEFADYYKFKQLQWWNEILKKGAKRIPCMHCNNEIRKPEQMIMLGGIPRHGNCLKEALKTGSQPVSDYSRPYLDRILQAVFQN